MSTTRQRSQQSQPLNLNALLQARESEDDPLMRATNYAIDRRVVSPTIVQEMKARGVAQVLVYMRGPVTSGLAASEEGMPDDLRRCFTDSTLSSSYAIRRARTPRSRRENLSLSAETPGDLQMFENLGVMVGTVDPRGLRALQEHGRVAAVTGSPQISLIRSEPTPGTALSEEDVWGAAALGVSRLWAEGFDGTGVLVGHLDTGVDGSHEALQGAIAAFTDTDDLGQLKSAKPFDSGDHGTHTAGTIAGRTGNIGIAPGCKLVSAVVIEDGDPIRRVLAGLNWAVGKGVRIINMSFGLRGFHEDFQPLIDAIRAKNILPIVAVGNEGPGTSRSPGNYENVLSVGAIDVNRKIFDNSSSQTFVREGDTLVPDLVAPGVAIVSAMVGGGFTAKNGTSMAAPHISGLAALLFQAKPDATASQVEEAIFASCDLPSSLDRDRANRGLPDAVKALEALTGTALSLSMPARKSPRRPTKARERRKGTRRPNKAKQSIRESSKSGQLAASRRTDATAAHGRTAHHGAKGASAGKQRRRRAE